MVNDFPGFATSRLGVCLGLEALFRAPTLLRSKVAGGKLGKKSGEGFYKWGP